MSQYQHRSVWIIGASHGIGRALAEKLDHLGCRLILSSRSSHDLQELNATLTQEALIFPVDVTNHQDFSLTAQSVFSQQRLDYIFYFPGFYEPASLENISHEMIDATLNVNFKSVIYLLKWVLPYLKQYPQCELLVTSSVAGYVGLPHSQPYAATKAAVINLMESVRAEYSELKLRLISPGFVKTRLTDKNTFSMPGIISPERAAELIVAQLHTHAFEITFPRKISCILKFFRMIPYRSYFYLMKKYFNA